MILHFFQMSNIRPVPAAGLSNIGPRSFHIFSQMFNIRSVLFNISGRWSNILFDRKAGLSKIVPERFNI